MLTGDDAKKFCTDLLMDVALARSTGDSAVRLDALLRAALFYPVRLGWSSPVDGWLDEAAPLAAELGDRDAQASIAIRRAACAMRQLDFDAALRALDDAAQFAHTPSTATWTAVTRARTLIRAQTLEEARAVLDGIHAIDDAHWSAGLVALARAEIELQAGNMEAAEPLYEALIDTLDERLVEEHIDVLQSLAFCRFSARDARGGARRLREARDVLAAVGIAPEVAQMDLALGHVHLALGDHDEAKRLLEEAGTITADLPQTAIGAKELGALSEMGLALTHAEHHSPAEARAAAARAASLFGRLGNAPGYLAMLLLVAALYENDRDFAGAYKTLAVGQAAARHLGWPQTAAKLQREIGRLRDMLGTDVFETLASRLLEELRQAKPV
jgi:tetratricopeptide (TPR) repeat protein